MPQTLEGIDPKVVVAIIAALSAIIGGIIGFLSKSYAAAQKLREMQYEYERRSQEDYLASARAFTKDIYVPLSISIANLNQNFQEFIANVDENHKSIFKKEIYEFLYNVDSLLKRGASAFLTTELDEILTSFCTFIRNSTSVNEVTIRTVFSYNFSSSLISALGRDSVTRDVSGGLARKMRVPRVTLNLFGVGLSFEANEIISAPIDSEDFQRRFSRDMHAINVLIKEVTLGAKARQPGPG